MKTILASPVTICVLALSASTAADEPNVAMPVWSAELDRGGWGRGPNSAVEQDAEGVILKAFDDHFYGSVSRSLGEIDLDRVPYFVVEVDKAGGDFACKLVNRMKNDKQVIFPPAPGNRLCITHLPTHTGWSGKVSLGMLVYCHGRNKSLRIKRIEFVAEPTKEMIERHDQTNNLLVNSSFELDAPDQPPIQLWHRLGGYLPTDTPWSVVVGDAVHGQKLVQTTTPGKLVMQREIHSRGSGIYNFSVYLKATKAGHRAKLSITTYRQGKPFRTDTEDQEETVGTSWTRYQQKIDVPAIRNRGLLGAVDLAVESLDEGEICADALQFEAGDKPSLYGEHRSLLSYSQANDLRHPLYPPVRQPLMIEQAPSCQMGTIELAPLQESAPPRDRWPMLGTVTLPQGQSYDPATWRLDYLSGQALPLQTRVLARWKNDGSIKAAELISQSDKSAKCRLRFNVKGAAAPIPQQLQKNGEGRDLFEELAFEVTGADGTTFKAAASDHRHEEEGPLRTCVREEGVHRSTDGRQLLSHVCRRHIYHGSPLRRIEYSWINTNASPTVAIRSLACRIPLDAPADRVVFFGPDGKTHVIDSGHSGSILQCNESKKYFYEVTSGGQVRRFDGKAAGRVRVEMGDKVLEMLVENFWQNHPLEIAVDTDGVTVFFWPPKLKAVEITQGMAKTFVLNLWCGKKDEAGGEFTGPVRLAPPPSIHCASGVFGGQILPHDGSPFPLFEQAVSSQRCLAKLSPDVIVATDSFGQFNFGDTMGDGGWANLEPQRGHAAWLHYLRTGDPAMFQVAQAAARHYRDIDIDQISGSTITHNPSHTLGGKSTSHAWIQGMLDHYLVTGERRSMEVALLHADYLKKQPLDNLVAGGRTVTRILDNLADLYMLTGDDELVTKYHTIVAAQRENLVQGDAPFPGVFQSYRDGRWTYPSNFVPWYGLYSQVKMRLATDDAAWEQALAEEIGYAMAKRPFEHARPEYFRDNDLTDDQRIVRCLGEGMIGDRGSMLFGPLGYAWRWTSDRRYLDLGMGATYIAIVSGEYRDPLYALAAVFLEQARQAGLGPEDERRAYQEALKIMKGTARASLSNPSFEEGRRDWKAWSVKGSSSTYWGPIRDGCLIIDTTNKREGRQSLRMIVTRRNPPQGFGVPLDSEVFLLSGGKSYVLEGWVRTAGDVSGAVRLGLRPLGLGADPASFRARMSPPESDGWQRWRLEADVKIDSLARLTLNLHRATAKSEGEAWWDGIIVRATPMAD